MQLTPILGLEKPEGSDVIDYNIFDYVFDILDKAIIRDRANTFAPPNGTTISVIFRRNSSGATADFIEFQDELGNVLTRVAPDGSVWANGEKLSSGISTAPFSSAKLYHSVNQPLASGTSPVSFDSEARDTNGYHSTTANISRITIPANKAGSYLINGFVEFFASGAGTQRSVWIRKNGTTPVLIGNVVPPNASSSSGASVSGTVDLVVGDYIELMATQDSGGSLNIYGGDSDTRLEAILLNPTVITNPVSTGPDLNMIIMGAY